MKRSLPRLSPQSKAGDLSPAALAAMVLRLAVAASPLIPALFASSRPAHAVTIDWVTVGHAGNANDPATGGFYGAVAYNYRIGKYEVTIQQYTDFLNAVDPNGINAYSLYNNSMGSDGNSKGISFNSAAASGQKYSPIGSAARPITYVSWFDAARFANWMHNGQGEGSTETGAYTLVGGQTSGTAPPRNPDAQFSIPTDNEWYKAAYYSPVKGGSGSPGYYTYATQSNIAPGNEIGAGGNQANYYVGAYPNGSYATGGVEYISGQNYLTDVGAFTHSASFYGTFDQSGNVYEWTDLTGAADTSRGLWGGAWFNEADGLRSASSGADAPSFAASTVGFRLTSPAAVPEPSACMLAVVGLASGYSMWRQRRRPS